MATLTCPDNFLPTHVSVKVCFCGKRTVEDHDFCFCSPHCARADAMRALGEDDCHYRKVMRSACASSGLSEPTIHRHKSEYHLRDVSNARNVSIISHRIYRPTKLMHEKPLPALPEATLPSLPSEGRYDPRRLCESRTEFDDAIAIEPKLSPGAPQRTIKRSLTSRTGLGQGVRNSVITLLRKATQPTAPLKVQKKVPAIRKEPSVATVPLDAMDEEEEEAAFRRMLAQTENRDKAHHHDSQMTTAIRRSGCLRRSVSFAGCNTLPENRKFLDKEGGPLMQLVFELRQTWDEMPEVMPDFDYRSDEE